VPSPGPPIAGHHRRNFTYQRPGGAHGVVDVDVPTRTRTIKASGHWYASLIVAGVIEARTAAA